MVKKHLLIVPAVVITFLALGGALWLWRARPVQTKTPPARGTQSPAGKRFGMFSESKELAIKASPLVLYLTAPVHSLSGKIDKLERDTVWVSSRLTLSGSEAVKKEDFRTLTFKVKTSSATTMVELPTYVPYLFKSIPSVSERGLTINQLKPGQYVVVQTAEDLRLVPDDSVSATRIERVFVANSLSGAVAAISGNTLTLKTRPPQLPRSHPDAGSDQPERSYRITLTPETEISRNQPRQRLTLTDLSPGVYVTVYADSDVSLSDQLTAVRIEL